MNKMSFIIFTSLLICIVKSHTIDINNLILIENELKITKEFIFSDYDNTNVALVNGTVTYDLNAFHQNYEFDRFVDFNKIRIYVLLVNKEQIE